MSLKNSLLFIDKLRSLAKRGVDFRFDYNSFLYKYFGDLPEQNLTLSEQF